MAGFEVPEGWTAQAYRFALDPTPTHVRALASRAPSRRWRTTQARVGRTHAHGAATRCTRPPPPWPRNTGWSWSKRSTLPACVALVGPANVASTVPWLMPPWPRCGACSAAKLVGTVPIWRKPTGIFRRRRPARAVGGESQTSRWPIESSTASTAARGSIVIWVLRSTSPDSANPTGVNRVPPGVARWQDVEPRMRPNAPAGDAAGNEASTPHHHPVDQTGTASPQGETA